MSISAIDFIKQIYRKPSPVILARQELEEAQRELLKAQTGFDFAKRTVEYNQDRIKRLTVYLRDAHPDEKGVE